MDYVPRKDDDLFNFQGNLVNIVVANKVAWGISDPAVAILVNHRSVFEPLYTTAQNKKNRTSADVLAFRLERKSYETDIRAFAKAYLMFNPLVPPEERRRMGLTIPDKEPTPTAPDYVVNLDAPVLVLDWSHRGEVIIHFGVTPTNEKLNAKPVKIAGAKIWYRIESGPWVWVADDTNSPYTHNLAPLEPTNVEYRAQWFDKKGRTGSFSETAKCTVSP